MIRFAHASAGVSSSPEGAGTRAPISGREGLPQAAVDVDPDVLDDLGDRIATLAAHIHAASHRLLTLIAEFDRLRGWEPAGFSSCARWLAFRTGIDLGAAREKVRAARALERLPETSAAMARGELSFAKVRAVTRVADADNESELLELARESTAAQLERVVRGWRRLSRLDEAERERVRHASRCLSVFPDEEGSYLVRGRLDPEVGALLMRAIEAASDALYRAAPEGTTPEQRRADAVALVAERALAAGFGGGSPAEFGGGSTDGDAGAEHAGAEDSGDGDESAEHSEERRAGADGSRAEGSAARQTPAEAPAVERSPALALPVPVSGSRAERYQVVLHVEAATLQDGREPGCAELEDGTRVSAEGCRRLACDTSVVEVRHGSDGSILDVGRKTRTIPPAIRRALEARDRGCRFPGCGSRFCDAHHVRHWADGGPTRLGNLILLCRAHHRLLHERGFRVEMNDWPGGRPVFYNRRGLPVPEGPPRILLGPEPVEALLRDNRSRGVEPEWNTCSARFRREADIPQALYVRVFEAVDGGVND